MNSHDIICAGEMLIDFTPDQKPFTFTANPGGAPANVAVSTAKNGLSTAFLGVLGNDDFGKRLKSTLEDHHITLLCPDLTDEAITTLAFVTLYENGERSFTFARKPGADILLSKEDVDHANIPGCRMFHAGSFSLSDNPSREAIQYAMKLAHEHHKLVSFDVNYRDMIWHDIEKCKTEVDAILPYVDFLKISDEELYFVGGAENIHTFMEQHQITVVVQTLGADGAIYYFNGTQKHIPGNRVRAIDATGAGDAFWGGFLSKLLMQGVSHRTDITSDLLEAALLYGNMSGGLCVQTMGGIPAIPNKEQIERELQK